MTDFLLRRVVHAPADVFVTMGPEPQPMAIGACLQSRALWRAQPWRAQVASLVRRRWEPSPDLIQRVAQETFTAEVFGGAEDFGDHLGHLLTWHHARVWDLSGLTEDDAARAGALESFSILTRMRLRPAHTHPALRLTLFTRAPFICVLAYPMIAKIPVMSIRFFLDVQVTFAFASIRRSGHPHADDLIAYLYDLLFLQQKIAIALFEFVRLTGFADVQKGTAGLINAEVNAIMQADLIFAYLKATVEKILALVAATYGVTGLDGKKTHAKRLTALRNALPEQAAHTSYGAFLLDVVTSENLDDLNSYRSGLLHKKGVADLQPHNYVGVGPRDAPFDRVFRVLHEQHAKNTAALLAALALLTDDLVRRDPPPFSPVDIPIWDAASPAAQVIGPLGAPDVSP